MKTSTGLGLLRLILFFSLIFISFEYSFSENLNSKIDKILLQNSNKNSKIGLFAVEINQQGKTKPLLKLNSEDLFSPASIQKLITSLAVIDKVSPFFTYKTSYLGEMNNEGNVETLTINASGDPTIVSERIFLAAKSLKERGIKSIGNINLNSSIFKDTKPRLGINAYEAGTSAFSVNFNTIQVQFCKNNNSLEASIPDESGYTIDEAKKGDIFIHGEENEDINIIWKNSSHIVFRGTFHLDPHEDNQLEQACIKKYYSVLDPEKYFKNILTYHLLLQGIKVKERGSQIKKFDVNPKKTFLLYKDESKYIYEIIKDLNNYSNNFIAEQLVYLLCYTNKDSVLSYYRGLQNLNSFVKSNIEKKNLKNSFFTLVDGSGLSLKNKLSPEIILSLLTETNINEPSSILFINSLPIAGKTGSLKFRNFSNSEFSKDIIFAKTGTLNTVSSLAGFILTDSVRDIGFVVMQNDLLNIVEAKKIEEDLILAISSSIELSR